MRQSRRLIAVQPRLAEGDPQKLLLLPPARRACAYSVPLFTLHEVVIPALLPYTAPLPEDFTPVRPAFVWNNMREFRLDFSYETTI